MLELAILAVLFVNADGSGQYPTIQAAVDAAVDGDEIHLTTGTFEGAGNRDIDGHGKAIKYRPADSAAYVWMMPGTDGGIHQAFIFDQGEPPETIVELIAFLGWDSEASPSRGIICIEGSSPTVRLCNFESNSGTAIFTMGGSPLIHDCSFSANSSSANPTGIRSIGGYAKIDNCGFSQNWSGSGEGAVVIDSGRIDSGYFNHNSPEDPVDITVTVSRKPDNCVLIVNSTYNFLKVLPGACVRILKHHPDEYTGPPPLSLSPTSWGAIKASYR